MLDIKPRVWFNINIIDTLSILKFFGLVKEISNFRSQMSKLHLKY